MKYVLLIRFFSKTPYYKYMVKPCYTKSVQNKLFADVSQNRFPLKILQNLEENTCVGFTF